MQSHKQFIIDDITVEEAKEIIRNGPEDDLVKAGLRLIYALEEAENKLKGKQEMTIHPKFKKSVCEDFSVEEATKLVIDRGGHAWEDDHDLAIAALRLVIELEEVKAEEYDRRLELKFNDKR